MKPILSAIAAALALGACSQGANDRPATEELRHDRDAAWTPPEGLPPFAERVDPNPGVGNWMNRLEPQPTGACSFSEHAPEERPADLVLTAWSGNLDLYTPPDTLEHRRADGFIESQFMNARSVVAVRKDMDDLWIEPVGENVVLYIGENEFACRRAPAEG